MPTRRRFDSMSARDTGLSHLLRRLDRLEGNPELTARSTGRAGTGGGVDPTFLVAASNASPGMRAAADFVCTGSGDQAEIQAAFNALPPSGGRVQLTEGTFNIVRGTLAGTALGMPHNSELVGSGPGTVLSMTGAGFVGVGPHTYTDHKTRIANLSVDVSGVTNYGFALYLVGPSTVESCWFTGLGQADELGGYITIDADNMQFKPLVTGCHFYDVYQGSGNTASAVEGGVGQVDSCTFHGATGGLALDLFGFEVGISNSKITGCAIRADSIKLTVTGCVFNTIFGHPGPRILLADTDLVSITGCIFDGSYTGPYIGMAWTGAWVAQTVIEGNAFYSGWVDLGDAAVAGLVVSNNVLYGYCDLTYDSGASARIVRDVNIHGNVVAEAFQSSRASIRFLGTDLDLENISIVGNTLISTTPEAATSMIDVQFTRNLVDNGQGIRIADNVIEFFATTGGYAIRVRGRTGATHGHVVVSGNQFRAAGMGVLVDDVRDVVVSNNVQGITGDDPLYNDDRSNQLTIAGADSAIVDGNKWIAGEKGDDAGTGAAIYVEATVGAVRNNDIWGEENGAMDTALLYSAALVNAGNVYHGLHSSQTGSVFTNGIVSF